MTAKLTFSAKNVLFDPLPAEHVDPLDSAIFNSENWQIANFRVVHVGAKLI